MKNKYLVNVSPWILAAACTLLTLIITVFAVNNYSREKKLMQEALLQKGLTIMRVIDAGVRVSMRAQLQGIDAGTNSWRDHVQNVIDQLPEQADVQMILLVDVSGKILAGTDRERLGANLDDETLQFVHDGFDEPVYRLREIVDNPQGVFQVARAFVPNVRMSPPHDPGANILRMGRIQRQMGGRFFQRWQQELERIREARPTLIVELDLNQYNSVVKQQLFQIIILSLVLLLVGIGGWLSLITLHGYRGSQIRLKSIRAFNDILVESLPVGLIATDRQGRVQMINDAAKNIIALPAEEIIGRQAQGALPRPLARRYAEMAETTLKTPVTMETTLEDGAGVARTLLLTMLSIVDDERQTVGTVLLMQDLSEIKTLEKELQRQERFAALGKMAAGLAHELRNPLSSIKGLTVLLTSKTAENSEEQKTADILVQEVERLNRSIGELLDYARPEQLQKTQVLLGEVVNKTLTLISMDAQSLGVSVSFHDGATGEKVFIDRDKLNQVLLNLLLNALQAMDEGGELRVTTSVEDGRVVCCIEDTGVGIPPENLAKVFDPYFTTKSDGTGLGLAMSAKIVEEHGGTIVVDSTPAVGTKVCVTLPAVAHKPLR